MSNRTLATRSRMITVFMLLALVLAGVSSAVSADSLRNSSTPQAGQEPDKIIRTSGAKPGVYYIDYGSRLNPATYPVDGAIRFFQWTELNGASGSYNWAALDNWIADRKSLGLGTGIMLTTYDGSTAGDIRATPDYVIKQANAVLPATAKDCSSCAEYPHYVNYWRRSNFNAGFEYSPHTYGWLTSGAAAITATPLADAGGVATGYAAELGGTDNAAGTLIREATERIPAMPAGITPAKTVSLKARIGIVTTDAAANDHLYFELQNSSGVKLTQFDVTNLSHASGTWQDYEFDISAFAPEKPVKVAFKVVTDGASPTTFYVDTISLNVRHLIPNYYPTDAAKRSYLNAYKTFISAMGARYKDNADLQFVAIGTGVYGENQPTQSDSFPGSNFDHVVSNAGLTSAGWVEYVNAVNQAHATAFSSGLGDGPARHLMTQYAPSYKSIDEREQITNYAASIGVGLSANFLSPDWTQSYRNDNDGFYDPIRRYWNQVPIARESYDMDLCNPVLSFWAIIGGVEKHTDYLRVDPTLIRNAADGSLTAHAPFYDWASNYLGKTVNDTPRVWTVMREHRNPTVKNCRPGGVETATSTTGSTWPQLGNLNFWLYQVDSIPGGRTVPETNDKSAQSTTAQPDLGLGNCPEKSYRTDLYGENYPCNRKPYNADLPALGGQDATFFNLDDWTGAGKEAYVVRRTDQNADAAKNNPFMFFRIDDGYINGSQVYKATFTVKYFDIGTDKWSLKYDSTSGEKVAGTITKTGTKQLKTYTVTVTDAKFANRLTGSTDFYLDSRAPDGTLDGNEWLHMVEVEKLDSVLEPTHTPTVTPTPTETATPTVTPTATPNTGIVEGTAYYDANSNNFKDAGETGVAGAVLALHNTLNVEVATALSGADGVFRFTGVAPGQYTLLEKTPPPGYTHNTTYAVTFLVNANQTISGFNIGHRLAATATPTATATASPTATNTPTTGIVYDNPVYLPLLLR